MIEQLSTITVHTILTLGLAQGREWHLNVDIYLIFKSFHCTKIVSQGTGQTRTEKHTDITFYSLR